MLEKERVRQWTAGSGDSHAPKRRKKTPRTLERLNSLTSGGVKGIINHYYMSLGPDLSSDHKKELMHQISGQNSWWLLLFLLLLRIFKHHVKKTRKLCHLTDMLKAREVVYEELQQEK